jgi:hypothetical protein
MNRRHTLSILPLVALGAFVACSTVTAPNPTATTVIGGVANLAQLAAAAGVPDAGAAVTLGELFCGSAGQIAAMSAGTNKIVSVIGKTATEVASYCPAGWAPVSPPANPAATPVVAAAKS